LFEILIAGNWLEVPEEPAHSTVETYFGTQNQENIARVFGETAQET